MKRLGPEASLRFVLVENGRIQRGQPEARLFLGDPDPDPGWAKMPPMSPGAQRRVLCGGLGGVAQE